MTTYRYARSDPRSQKSFYSYAPFEGIALLRAWSEARTTLIATVENSESLPGAASMLSSDIAAAPPFPPSGPIDTASTLRACAILVRANDSDERISAWANFALRKIEIARRLRRTYDADGKKIDDTDAGAAAYAFAARLFAGMVVRRRASTERLKWLNALMKCLDILHSACAEANGLDAEAAACALESIRLEREQVAFEAGRQNVSWPS